LPNAEDKIREKIRSIEVCLYPELAEEAYNTAWGYLQALIDFELISQTQYNSFEREAASVRDACKRKLAKKKR